MKTILLKRLKDLLCLDTAVYEIYTGVLMLMWGIMILLPDERFPPGPIFGVQHLTALGFIIGPHSWAILFFIVGILRLYSLIVECSKCRYIMSYIVLYVWILVGYYTISFAYSSAIAFSNIVILVLFSVFSVLRLWKYR